MSEITRPRALGVEVWKTATVVILGSTMSFLDSTIINVALHALSENLSSPLDTIQWVVTAYLLALAASIPVSGWASRRFGAQRTYVFAVSLFTVGSLACGMAQTAGQLIFFRILQGIGGGLIMPVGQVLLARVAGPEKLPRVMAIIGVPTVLAPVFGPFIGGLLLDHLSWRWIFFVNLPVGAIAVACALLLLRRDPAEDVAPLDLLGLLLVSTGMVCVTYGLGEVGSGNRLAVTALGVGAVLMVVFVIRTLGIAHPLFDVRLYQQAVFRTASMATFVLAISMYGGMVLMPLYFQIVRGENAITTAMLLAPTGIGAAVGSWLSARAVERFGNGRAVLIGAVISFVGILPFAFLTATMSYAMIIAASVLSGLGTGLAVMPAMTAAYRTLDQSKMSDASPQLNILQRLGGSIATAVLLMLLQRQLDAHIADPASAFAITFRWALVGAGVAIVAALALTRAQSRQQSRGGPTAT